MQSEEYGAKLYRQLEKDKCLQPRKKMTASQNALNLQRIEQANEAKQLRHELAEFEFD